MSAYGGVGQATDGLVEAVAGAVEAFDRALAGAEGFVVVVDVAGDEVAGFGIGAGHQHGRHAQGVGGQAGGDELATASRVGTNTLPPMWPQSRRWPVGLPEVHAGGAGFDHGLHQLEGAEHATKAGPASATMGRRNQCRPLPRSTGSGRRALKVALILRTTFGTESTL